VLSENDITINKIAQDKITLEEGIAWFDGHGLIDQRDILTWLRIYLEQSHPDRETIDKALKLVPLKQTITPIVIFKTHSFRTATMEVNALPDNELQDAFVTMMILFKYADKKRRMTLCKNGCTHEWHHLD
jgi:uncharacterized protein DUF5958